MTRRQVLGEPQVVVPELFGGPREGGDVIGVGEVREITADPRREPSVEFGLRSWLGTGQDPL